MSELKRIHFQDPFSLCSETRVFHATEALSLGIIYSILVHPQLPIVISGDQKGSVSLWHLETETLIAHEEGVHSGTVSALQITDLNRFISTAFDKCINMINIERRHDIRGFLKSISEDCRRLLPETMQKLHQSRLTRMASYFKREAIPQPTTKHSALERNKYAVKMARKKSIRGFQSDICCMEFIEGENTLITAHMDGTLQVWDSSMLCVVKTMYAHKDSILALCLHDGYLYSGSTDKTIKSKFSFDESSFSNTAYAHKI
jgi:WD40 repeat protein